MELVLSSIANFLAVILILWFFGRKPISAFLVTRSEQVKSQIETATESYESAEKELKLWQVNSASGEAHAKQLRVDAKGMVDRFRDEQQRSADNEIERIKRDSALLVENEATKAKKLLEEAIIAETLRDAKDQLKKQVGDKEQTKLLGDYLERVAHVAS